MAIGSDEVLSIGELAAYLKISKSTLYQLAQRGRVPATKVGKHWRFHKATIEDWLRQRPEHRGAKPGTKGKAKL